LFKINPNHYVIMTGLGVVCFVLILLVTLTHQTANAENSTSNNSNIGTAKAPVANGTNKTIVIAAPGAAATRSNNWQ